MTFAASLFLLLLGGLAACGGDDAAGDGMTRATLNHGMPCDVQPLIEKYCGTCHGQTPMGAPMSLASVEDFQTRRALNGEWMHARVLARLHDVASPMPPVARPQPSPAELSVLDRWLQGGAQKSKVSECVDSKSDADAGVPVPLPPVIPDTECEVILELRTHDLPAPGDKTPYQVTSDEHYECFYYPVPWNDKMHVLKIEPLVDNAQVLHHYLLYQETPQVAENGTHARCGGAHPTAALLTGWAPGGFGTSMPADVGLQVASGDQAQFNLEVHYSNFTGQTQGDSSGVRICATSKLRKNEAAAHWLGTELIFNLPGPSTAQSSCNPKSEAHILSVSPHMHRTGRHMKTTIARANGTTEMLTDRPFDFNDQQIYPVGGAAGEVIVGPGDRLDTVCDFDNDTGKLVTFGSLTSQEMCYNFVVAWPAGALDTGGGLVQGPNRCME